MGWTGDLGDGEGKQPYRDLAPNSEVSHRSHEGHKGHVAVRRVLMNSFRQGPNEPRCALLQPLPKHPLYLHADTIRLTPTRTSPFPAPHFHIPTSGLWLGYLLALNATLLIFAYHKTPCSSSPRANTTCLMQSLHTAIFPTLLLIVSPHLELSE